MLFELEPGLVELVQTGVDEAFPTNPTVAQVKAWLERNQDQIHWTGQAVLEDALEAANPTQH